MKKWQELADMMEKDTKAKWGNWVGYILLPFDIGFENDPLDYIRKSKATIDRKKHSLEVVCTSAIADIILKVFGIKVRVCVCIYNQIFCKKFYFIFELLEISK